MPWSCPWATQGWKQGEKTAPSSKRTPSKCPGVSRWQPPASQLPSFPRAAPPSSSHSATPDNNPELQHKPAFLWQTPSALPNHGWADPSQIHTDPQIHGASAMQRGAPLRARRLLGGCPTRLAAGRDLRGLARRGVQGAIPANALPRELRSEPTGRWGGTGRLVTGQVGQRLRLVAQKD